MEKRKKPIQKSGQQGRSFNVHSPERIQRSRLANDFGRQVIVWRISLHAIIKQLSSTKPGSLSSSRGWSEVQINFKALNRDAFRTESVWFSYQSLLQHQMTFDKNQGQNKFCWCCVVLFLNALIGTTVRA